MKRFASLPAIAIAALISSTAAAQVVIDEDAADETPLRRYTVEVIVFAYTEDVSVGSEIFLPDEPPPEEDVLLDEDGNPIVAVEEIPVFGDDVVADDVPIEDVEEDLPPTWIVVPAASTELDEDPVPNPFQLVLLTEDEFALGDALRQFELLDAYETIMHVGWTQPAFPEEETPAIELPLLAEPPVGLNGTLTLYLSRYLHLVVDLALDAPSEFEEEVVDDDAFFSFGDARGRDEDESQAMPIRFRIQENRIFKNGDLRYFDHPRFGVLAKVTRVEEPEEEESPESLARAAR